MGQISVGFRLANAVLNVEVPTGGRRKPATQYTTHRFIDAGGVHVGEALPLSGAIRIVQLQEDRRDRIAIESAPQRLFGAYEIDKDELTENDLSMKRADAEDYVTGLVSAALRRVIFVDPDFGLRELQNYALRVIRDSVEVKILTSARRMRDSVAPANSPMGQSEDANLMGIPAPTHGVHLLAQLRHLHSRLGREVPEVFVMPGSNKPRFHDRFVVIDDVVWTCGPSFNELGERIGLISRAHEPRVIITAIEQVLCQSQSLADWVDQSTSQDPLDGGHDAETH
jgi:hypothetical protein